MKKLAFVVALVLVLLPAMLFAQTAPDFSGKWTGSFSMTSPQTEDDTAYIELKQKGADLTGVAGPNANQTWPLKGKVDGNKVTFEVQHDQMVLKFVLNYVDGHLKGDAAAEMNGQALAAKVDVTRAK